MSHTVAVLGGGIAGLTAAHELASRGLEVTVHEMRGGGARGLGGKARSQYFQVDGVEVPGEHGYRFMPAFYRVLPATMARIPLDAATSDPSAAREPYRRTVADRLVGLEHMAIAREGFPLLRIERNVPRARDLPGLMWTLSKAFHSIPAQDFQHLAAKMLHYFTRGPLERRHVFERISLATYLEADTLAPITQRLLEAMPQSLVAMRGSEGNARTLLDVLQLMMLDFKRPGPSEHVLNGPTTDTFLAPWMSWLERLGVRFSQGPLERIVALESDAGRVVRAHRAGGTPIEADLFVLALPVEAARAVLRASGRTADRCEQLARVAEFPLSATRWMVGAQMLLQGRDRPWARGHVAFGDSAWGITGVSQRQLWSAEHVARLERAGGAGMLSVILTEWGEARDCEVPAAKQLPVDDIRREIVRQISKCRDVEQRPMLRAADVRAFHLDQDVVLDPITRRPVGNGSPLLIHPPGIWDRRPTSCSQLSNLALAGDYVQNPMDLATMEGANASGRQAANVLLDAVDHRIDDRAPLVDDYQAEHVPWSLRELGRANDVRFQSQLDAAPPTRDALRTRYGLREARSRGEAERGTLDVARRVAAS